MRVLVIEDDVQIRTLVRAGLEQHDLVVTEAGTIAEAYEAFEGSTFDVIILDLTLPDGSGIDVLRHVNACFTHSHVIVLSGAITELDRIRGLELGADDYVVKPFSSRELTARVLAIRRRRSTADVSSIRFGNFEIDLVGRRLLADGAELRLSAIDFALLAFLAARAGHVFSRSELLAMVWKTGAGWHANRSIGDHVRRVRKAIEVDPRRPLLLRTVRGVGYCFDMPLEPGAGRGGDAVRVDVGGHGTVTTVDNRIVHADPAALTLLGFGGPSDVLGAHVLDFVAPQSLRSARERMRQVAAGSAARSQVLLVVRPDGAEMPLEITTSGTSWQGEEAIELQLCHAADESPRLRRIVTGVLSDVTDAVVITDVNMHVRSWNGAAERLYGWTESEVLGRHLVDVVGSSPDEAGFEHALAELRAHQRWHGSIEQQTRDGSTVAVRASMSVDEDETGLAIGVVSVNRLVLGNAVDALTIQSEAADLRRGLAAGEFEVHYQPVVSLDDGHVVTVEALARWNHPEEGLLPPATFIEAAERSAVIHELGAFVLETACRQVAAWRAGGRQVSLAVNLSAREFADPLLAQHIRETVASSGLDIGALWLEVTETALVEDVAQAGAVLRELADLGIGISIDDFGTGWASLTYLRQFPVHVLKIDRSFVTGVDHDPGCATIVRSILALGAELDLIVVAEGIETQGEADALLSMGCNSGQGYLYGRPVPAAEIDLTKMLPLRTYGRGPHAARPAPNGRLAIPPRADDSDPGVEDAAAVATVLRGLLRISSGDEAAARLQQAVRALGGSLVAVADAGPDAVPVDVSLGLGPALLPRADLGSAARSRLERTMPALAEDARHAVALLEQATPVERGATYVR